MYKLLNRFPNFREAIGDMEHGTDLGLTRFDNSKICYSMTFIIFNNKLGEIEIELREVGNSVALKFSTIVKSTVKAETTSELVPYDISKESWIELISETMVSHNHSPDHQQVLMDFTAKKLSNANSNKSGCLSLFLILPFLSVVIFCFYIISEYV
ncbi:hypothetical protein [Flavobacterium psychraquaticum]|uniref:hypothetical protein n=1 Tax=Flavobacterium psychraquaticum TaxID=3103958 RepID=UPI002ACED0D0|nr:hypothetical protein [Flavobacterium sp. LB-N7T]